MGTLPIVGDGSPWNPPRPTRAAWSNATSALRVFGQMLKKSLDGVDLDLLRKAVAAGLQNQDGRARGEIGHIYQQLSYEELKPLLPAIHEAIVKPSPSGIMFADGIRLSGLELLATHRIREGMELCLSEAKGLQANIDQLRKLIRDIEASTDAPGLIPLVE
jgi:hypothetical protein